MAKALVSLLGVLIAVPAHAVPIISLHGSGSCGIQAASTLADATWVAASLIALAAVVIIRMFRRKAAEQQRPRSR